MRRLLLAFTAACAALLSGCMALAVAPLLPVANSFTDKPVTWEYMTTAKKSAVFNAALKTLSAKGSATTIDREAGTIQGDVTVSKGQAAYTVVLQVEERANRTVLRVSAKLEGMMKWDAKNSSDMAQSIVEDIERQLGAKLERTT